MRITLLAPWFGPTPPWMNQFTDRVAASYPLVKVRFLRPHWHLMRYRIREVSGVLPPETISPRKMCDYRPAFGEIFKDLLAQSDWWGWCDLDCVFGRMGEFFTPDRLRDYDLITDHPDAVNGPITIMRNDEKTRTLYSSTDDFAEVFASGEHVAFDEKGFTDVVHGSGVRFLHLAGVHEHDRPRTAEIRLDADGRLLADGREILTYHFPGAKAWPTTL